ncbi:metallophosphoesterase [Rhodoferax sp. BLA1]|uniref:metallophosphoesterase family protein n=1 Tax=Rhodoferax sp. BLA1 TaxID=2576062 RepID=UPI0015D0D42E|nr:metallophosphoesterase [Rhodoferax sp. BLA1]
MILFCGDPHGQFEHIIAAVQEYRPAAVILLGDLQPQRPLEIELAPILAMTELWFIHGNHDTDSEADHDHLFGSDLADRNLHGRVVEIAGLRVAGLGGVFRGKVWTPPAPARFDTPQQYLAQCGKGNLWRGGLPLKHRSTIFPVDYEDLKKQRADILVTHEAPSAHPHGFAAIDELARRLGVRTTFHGHHHEQLDYSTERARLGFDAVGVGLRGIADMTGQVVRARELDTVPEPPC